MAEDRILVGKIVGAQGMRGELRVQTFTENPEDLQDFAPLKLNFVRTISQTLAIYKMDEVPDRTSAEKMVGTELYINRSDFPKLKKGEHYIADLIGMSFGKNKVVYIHNFGAGDILELDNGDMISFNGTTVDYDKREIKYER